MTIQNIKPKKVQNPITNVSRLRTAEGIEAFKTELLHCTWDGVYVDDPNEAHMAFLSKWLELYDRHCPLIMSQQKDKCKRNPWMTTGLQKTCQRKNVLYLTFIKNRTSENERDYKMYKNKLTSLLRTQKKLYYNKVFENSKNNIKQTWNVIN